MLKQPTADSTAVLFAGSDTRACTAQMALHKDHSISANGLVAESPARNTLDSTYAQAGCCHKQDAVVTSKLAVVAKQDAVVTKQAACCDTA